MPLTDTVRRRLGTTWRLLIKELSAFGIVGAVCFVIDVGLFQYLYAHVGTGAVTAKLVSTLVSMTLAYFGHRHLSFSHRARTGLRREYVLFVVVNGAALLLGLTVIAFARYALQQDSPLAMQVANLVSIALGTVLRYFCYRRWVFPAAVQEPVPVALPVEDVPPPVAETAHDR